MRKSRCAAVNIFVTAALCAGALAQSAPSRVVQLQQGPVRGYRDPQWDLYTFYNIPYATAPQGRDRFKAPLAPPRWTEIREAVDQGTICPHGPSVNDDLIILLNKTMSPDCLIANIYVPDTTETNLPVLVSVHGGAFQIMWGTTETLNNLVHSQKIIYVSFNYRLGPYGFLCLGTEDAPGNAGMKDQVALLRWVKENIASFGGNPYDITINGCSAGGGSVDLLMLSKTTEGLFNKAIPGSGASLSPWAVQVDPISNAKEYAKLLDFHNVDDFNALTEFYMTTPLEELLKYSFETWSQPSKYLFVPCVERDVGVERFLDDAPFNILKNNLNRKIPLLYGFADMEGLFRVGVDFEDWAYGMNTKFSDYLPPDLQFASDEEKEQVANRVKQFYFDDRPVSNDTLLEYIDYFTDTMFSFGPLRATKLQVESGNDQIYLFEYSFIDGVATIPPGITNNEIRGATHCAQIVTLIDGGIFEVIESAETRQMRAIIRELWLNFITTGTPAPAGSSLSQWPAASAARSPHMELTLPPQLRGALLPERMSLWDDIYSKHYLIPSPPKVPNMSHKLYAHYNVFAIIFINLSFYYFLTKF